MLEPEFTPYIEYVGFGATTEEMVPELLDLTTGQLKALDRHPVSNLLEAVDRGLPARIARYMSDIRSQGEPQTAQPIRGGVVPIAASSYVRAMDRFRSNMPSYADGSLPRLPSEIIDRHHIVRYNQLKRLGVSPVGVEALASITQDFYEMVGGFMPGFTRFRKQQRSDDKSGGSDAPYLPPSY